MSRIEFDIPEFRLVLDIKPVAEKAAEQMVLIAKKRLIRGEQVGGSPIPVPQKKRKYHGKEYDGVPGIRTRRFLNSIRARIRYLRNGLVKIRVGPRGERSIGILKGFAKRGIVISGFVKTEIIPVSELITRTLKVLKESGQFRVS